MAISGGIGSTGLGVLVSINNMIIIFFVTFPKIIKAHLEKEQNQTPLQEKLDRMAEIIGYVGMAAAAMTK